MNILALLHSPRPSGNDTTIRRITSHLAAGGHGVTLMNASDGIEHLHKVARLNEIDLIIGTHALFSGRYVLEAGLPYLLIFAGTDLNEFSLDEASLSVMTSAVEGSAGLIVLNEDFQIRCTELWPHVREKLHKIPQAIWTKPSAFSLRENLGLPTDAKLILLPSGLRPIKDPLYSFRAINAWHEQDPRIHLVIAGTSYDEDFEGIVMRRIASSKGIHYAGAILPENLHASMCEATALINTSISECSPNSVLEAMELQCPVIVRDIPGNTCVVQNESTGLVFSTPDELREQGQRLLDDKMLAQELGRNGLEFVSKFHNLNDERAAYLTLIESLGTYPSSCLKGRAPMRERMIELNDVVICAEMFGNPEDPAVLLIAGASDSMLFWDSEFCSRMAGGGRYVIRYDHRDTGRSTAYPPGQPPYTLRNLAADATALLNCLNVTTAHLVGVSMGGMIVQIAALMSPEVVNSLTLFSSSPGDLNPEEPDLPSPTLRVSIALDDIVEPDWADKGSVVDYLVAVQRCLASDTREFDDAGKRSLARDVFDRSDGKIRSMRNHNSIEWGDPWRGRLAEITAPTLIIHGKRDQVNQVPHAEALARGIPQSKMLLLKDAGHELAPADWGQVLTAILQHTS